MQAGPAPAPSPPSSPFLHHGTENCIITRLTQIINNAASRHCAVSPDGRLIATSFPARIEFRSAVTPHDASRVVEAALPPDAQGVGLAVSALVWSASSRRLLVALPGQIHVFSPADAKARTSIRIPTPGARQPQPQPQQHGLARFGGRDTEICVWAEFGLKFTLIDLVTHRQVDICNLKFYHPPEAEDGFSFRPGTSHLAILTRAGGRDILSVHHPESRAVQALWHPDTVDAQAVAWTPHGRWLAVAESASQGHKLLFYAPDGHLYRAWLGPADASEIDRLGAGIRQFCLGGRDSRLAVCDHTRSVSILDVDASAGTEVLRLVHPAGAISLRDTVQVWQERLVIPPAGPAVHAFVRATRVISPPPTTTRGGSWVEPAGAGCVAAAFDSSSTLLATQLEDSDSTVWIWDVKMAELRAVIVFHAKVASFSWHGRVPELLLITCSGGGGDGDAYRDAVFVWGTLLGGPRPVCFGAALPGGRAGATAGRPHAEWLDLGEDGGAGLLVGDLTHHVLVSLADGVRAEFWPSDRSPSGSPPGSPARDDDDDDGDGAIPAGAEDTFAFKRRQ